MFSQVCVKNSVGGGGLRGTYAPDIVGLGLKIS